MAELISELKKLSIEQKVPLWKRIATELEKPTRNKRVVNLGRINRYAKQDETVLVPGKVLSAGELTQKVIVCAHRFSVEAQRKIQKKGKTLTIKELMKQNPKAAKVRIIG